LKPKSHWKNTPPAVAPGAGRGLAGRQDQRADVAAHGFDAEPFAQDEGR
jgi:hypothetical protein